MGGSAAKPQNNLGLSSDQTLCSGQDPPEQLAQGHVPLGSEHCQGQGHPSLSG